MNQTHWINDSVIFLQLSAQILVCLSHYRITSEDLEYIVYVYGQPLYCFLVRQQQFIGDKTQKWLDIIKAVHSTCILYFSKNIMQA